MGFQDAIRKCFANYATFSGRAPRSEFWWFFLFILLANTVLSFVDGALFGSTTNPQTGATVTNSVLGGIFSLAVLLPTIAVGVRRLHDRNMSGWWYLLIFLPLIGALILLYFFVQKGTEGGNQYGSDPLP